MHKASLADLFFVWLYIDIIASCRWVCVAVNAFTSSVPILSICLGIFVCIVIVIMVCYIYILHNNTCFINYKMAVAATRSFGERDRRAVSVETPFA